MMPVRAIFKGKSWGGTGDPAEYQHDQHDQHDHDHQQQQDGHADHVAADSGYGDNNSDDHDDHRNDAHHVDCAPREESKPEGQIP